MQSDFPKLRAIASSPTLVARPNASLEAIRAQIAYQTAYGLFLAVATMLNRLCWIAHGAWGLGGELDVLCDEIQGLGWRGLELRPLGSHYMPMSLSAAWAAVGDRDGDGDRERLGEIERLAREYCPSESLMEAWRERGMQTRRQFERLRARMERVNVVLPSGKVGLVALD